MRESEQESEVERERERERARERERERECKSERERRGDSAWAGGFGQEVFAVFGQEGSEDEATDPIGAYVQARR